MFTFSRGIFCSSRAHASAECKEADIQAVGSSTMAGFDAGIQVTMNTLRHGCHLGEMWDLYLCYCLFNVYNGQYIVFQFMVQ